MQKEARHKNKSARIFLKSVTLSSTQVKEDMSCSDVQESRAFCPYKSRLTQRKYIRSRNQNANLKSTSPWVWIRRNGEPEACCACVNCVDFNKDFGIYQRMRGFHSVPVKVTLPRQQHDSPLIDVTVGCTCVPNH